MKELVETIARALVDSPGEVVVKQTTGGSKSCVLELRVAKSDIGQIIGKQGRNAQAMRQILNAASARAHQRTVLEIIDKEYFP